MRDEIIAEARTFKGTKWEHQGRLKGVGVDCVGFIYLVGKAVGAIPPDTEIPNDYRRGGDGQELHRLLNLYLDPVSDWREALPGDVLAMTYNPQVHWHCMIVTIRDGDEFTIIEAGKGGVTEHRIDTSVKRRIHSAYRVRGIDERA